MKNEMDYTRQWNREPKAIGQTGGMGRRVEDIYYKGSMGGMRLTYAPSHIPQIVDKGGVLTPFRLRYTFEA